MAKLVKLKDVISVLDKLSEELIANSDIEIFAKNRGKLLALDSYDLLEWECYPSFDGESELYVCPNCKVETLMKGIDYCPHCGARLIH